MSVDINQFKVETVAHIRNVQENLNKMAISLIKRGEVHDNSKLEEPEATKFAELTAKMKDTEFGSDEYKRQTAELGDALTHHYQNNSHHIQHFSNEISGMNLLDLVEMFCDWNAAVKRNKNGNIYNSIEYHKQKFNLPEELCSIFRNSVQLLG